MALHPEFPKSPYSELLPDQRWFPAAEELRSTAYEKLLPPLVAKIRNEVSAWRDAAKAASLMNGKSEVVCEQGQLIKVSKDKDGVITRDTLTKHWADWVDYWAVDFDYMSRKEIIKVAKETGVAGDSPSLPPAGECWREGEESVEYEERWTGSYIFENEWQSFRTRKNRDLEFTSAPHTYIKAGRYTVAVKVIDIFGNDTMVLVPVSVG